MFLDKRGFILIVDDTPTNLSVISATLNGAGYEIAVATTGERALRQIERRIPDLILLDVMMPGIDGFETCRQLKNNPNYCEIPIIFITALADVKSKVNGFSLGAVDYVSKPFQTEEILARVSTHIKLTRTQQQLNLSEARLEKALNFLEEVVWSATLQSFQLCHISPAVTRLYGQTVDELIRDSSPWLSCLDAEIKAAMQAHCVGPSPEPKHFICEYQIDTAQGETRWVKSKIYVYYCPHQQQYMMDGITHDISDRKQAEAQLQYAATHDSLTGLVNRQCFVQTLERLLMTQPAPNFTVLFLDLDGFKMINDRYGHPQGDQVLKQVATLLDHALRPQDIVARLGGDEFTILLPEVSDEAEIRRIVQRLQSQLESGVRLNGQAIHVLTASIGVAIGGSQYTSAHELLRDADIAMYQAKKIRKDGYQIFNTGMYEAAVAKIILEQDLRAAVRQGVCRVSAHSGDGDLGEQTGLYLVYQPIYQLKDSKLFGFEALLRWQHPQQGMISPTEFIPLAEQTELIVPLGEQVLWEALSQLRYWQEHYPAYADLTMSVNLSIRQLQESNFLAMMDRLLQEIKIAPDCVKLEITESLLMQGGDVGFSKLTQLRERGFSLSLDDFGTGYSSLSYLQSFAIDTLKLDQSFIQKLGVEQNTVRIVRSMTDLAHSLGIDVVAEGVETAQQFEQLEQLGCDMVQGYLLSKPLTSSQAEAHLSSDYRRQPSSSINLLSP